MNPYELGQWTFPVLITNLILLSIYISYQGKILPRIITDSIKFICNFEVSRKITLLTILVLLTTYIGFSIQSVLAPELNGADYVETHQGAEQFNATTFLTSQGPVVHYSLIAISLKTLGNIRIIPFIESVSLLVLTYFITSEITQKRFAGIVSTIIVLQSQLFLKYDTDYAYANAWTLFYLLSLYLIQKRQWHLSIVSYVLSILSKALTVTFLPMTFFFIYGSDISRKTKIVNVIGFVVLSAFGIIYAVKSNYSITGLHVAEFWTGFTALENFLRSDGLILIFLLPLIIGLFIRSRRGIVHANSMMVLILGILLSGSVLVGLTDFTNQPYRYIPLVVFFAIGVGVLLSKRVNSFKIENKQPLSTIIFLITVSIIIINLIPVIFPHLIHGTYRLILNG